MNSKVSDITCVINAHRESHLVHPTVRSVKRARDYACEFGISVDILVVIDNGDRSTTDVLHRALKNEAEIVEVSHCDLALSRNHASSIANSKYIAFLDGDDLWCRSWLVDSYLLAKDTNQDVVLHPHYNVYFGETYQHVLKHVDMEDELYEPEFFLSQNYWTALSFGPAEIYRKYPYRRNDILEGFGYEDWTWHQETIRNGVLHKIVPNTSHFVRRGKSTASLLDQTNTCKAIPRIFELYRRSELRNSNRMDSKNTSKVDIKIN